jgi:hypothetical protein
MADAVATQIIMDGERLAILKFTNISDGTGESAVVKVDVSALASNSNGKACNKVAIEKIYAMTNGMSVRILWDATTDVLVTEIPSGSMDSTCYRDFGGLTNNAGDGITGDVSFTTVGHTAGDSYTIILKCIKSYV